MTGSASVGQDREVQKALQLYLDLDAGGELQAHHGFNSLVAGPEDVDQSLVGAQLELLAAVLVLMDGPEYRDDLLLRGQRHRPGDHLPHKSYQ